MEDQYEDANRYADPDCPGCRGGDAVPADAEYFLCPVCNAEWCFAEDVG